MDQILGLLNLVIDFLSNQFVDITANVLMIITGVFYAAKTIAKMTKTTKDDEFMQKVEDILEQLLGEKFPLEFSDEQQKKETIKRIAKNITKQ